MTFGATPSFASAVEFRKKSTLALTYNPTSLMDGLGSQLQRLYGVYALSRFLGCSYIHTPIQKISYQGLLALEKNEIDPELLPRCNQLFHIPSDREISPDASIYHFDKLKTDFSFFAALHEKLSANSGSALLKMGCPYFFVNRHPEMLHYVHEVTPFESAPSSLFKIAIHVRRGDLLISPHYVRLLPNSYYINLSLRIIEALQGLEIPFTCELHTEIPSKPFVVTPEHHGMKNRLEKLEKPIEMKPEHYAMEDFDVIPRLKKCINDDPLESLKSLATADLLITSRSAFSYVGAILNKKGIIAYYPFWRAAPLEWLDATHQASFDTRLVAACQQWKSMNHACLT
jgi:hypothetical protein